MQLGVSVAGALHYAHRHGVIRRDLKPENILLHEGQPMVADDVGPKGEILVVKPTVSTDQVIMVHNWRAEVRERLRRAGSR